MNTWNFSGEVLGHGIKGKKYPKLWIRVGLGLLQVPDYKTGSSSQLGKNELFVNIDLPETGPGAKVADFVKKEIESKIYIFIEDATIAPIKRSKFLGNDADGKPTFESSEERGLRGKVARISLSDTPYPIVNRGIVSGIVGSCRDYAAIVEDRYRNVATGEWKTREIPLVSHTKFTEDLVGKRVFASAQIAGTSPKGDTKVYVVGNHVVT